MVRKSLWQIDDMKARITATHAYLNVDYHIKGQWYRSRVGPIITEDDRKLAELEAKGILASFELLEVDGYVVYETCTTVRDRLMPPEPSSDAD